MVGFAIITLILLGKVQLPKLIVEGSIPFARSISAIVRPAVLVEGLKALARRLRNSARHGSGATCCYRVARGQ
ncbi:MAG: hypothetical protein AB7O44_29150 [Hyphomicrobiaceae bacterium]